MLTNVHKCIPLKNIITDSVEQVGKRISCSSCRSNFLKIVFPFVLALGMCPQLFLLGRIFIRISQFFFF